MDIRNTLRKLGEERGYLSGGAFGLVDLIVFIVLLIVLIWVVRALLGA